MILPGLRVKEVQTYDMEARFFGVTEKGIKGQEIF